MKAGVKGARLTLAVAAAGALAFGTAVPASGTSAAAGVPAPQPSYAATTGVGVHNAYEKSKYPYFADALDTGAAMLEIDVWTNPFGNGWRVSHTNPVGNNNNCENAVSASELRTKPRNQRLTGCLADIKSWHDAHPSHRPILLKVELKDGFWRKSGRGPGDLDDLLKSYLGNAVYRPGQLTADHITLDQAVRSDGWLPRRSDLDGTFIIELIPGTAERANPADTLWTDREYATHLRDLAAAGRLGEAAAFPAVLGAEPGDPRERYKDATIRPWFVVFDGNASTYASDTIDTKWYAERNYLVVMTDPHDVPPRIDSVKPPPAQAQDRVALLACSDASIVSSDWYALPDVLSTVLTRG
ncbi:phosphatidylinositol-specific phospholipase C domain-containing protein [Streptomyces sp. NPDC050658]|uniref:phosphatidylinositol-specific phospholipase C domain-containing protein n=1 Tax=unclassified Streptomyces TaxID=2593676 RepID=UPI0034347CB5